MAATVLDPFAVESGQRWLALALFLWAGSIATHGGAVPTSQARLHRGAVLFV